MKVRFWGVRGSIPCPGPSTARYGGNTPCLEVLGGSELIVADAGTGIRDLGLKLARRKRPLRVHLLLSHTHWDHIQGFPFFSPAYSRRNEIFIYGPRTAAKTLRDAIFSQMQHTYFPVRGVELAAKIRFIELGEETIRIGGVEISTRLMNHTVRVLAYRFRRAGRVAVYTGDNEPSGAEDRGVEEFCWGAGLLIADAQYTDREYREKRGWGHSPVSYALSLAAAGGVRKLVLFHHEPTHNDPMLDRMEKDARARARGRFKVLMAREGMVLEA